jgi:rubrerythrin
MSKAIEDLKAAFAGESQANRKYLAYAKKADQEGHPQVARMFRAAAAAETVHAHAHLRAMDGVGDTAANLQDAIAGETHEFTNMYPEMIEHAKAEGHASAQRSFEFANAVEKVHADLYQGLFASLGGDQGEFPYFVCPVCGYTVGEGAPDVCPICGTAGKMFEQID